MAEVLVYRKVPLEWIEGFVVFDQVCADYISNRYRAHGLTAPAIYINWFNDKPFFFRKFFFPDRKNETLVTGPLELCHKFQNVAAEIIDEFVDMGAIKIGINSTTHRPNVELLEQCLRSIQ